MNSYQTYVALLVVMFLVGAFSARPWENWWLTGWMYVIVSHIIVFVFWALYAFWNWLGSLS